MNNRERLELAVAARDIKESLDILAQYDFSVNRENKYDSVRILLMPHRDLFEAFIYDERFATLHRKHPKEIMYDYEIVMSNLPRNHMMTVGYFDNIYRLTTNTSPTNYRYKEFEPPADKIVTVRSLIVAMREAHEQQDLQAGIALATQYPWLASRGQELQLMGILWTVIPERNIGFYMLDYYWINVLQIAAPLLHVYTEHNTTKIITSCDDTVRVGIISIYTQ